MRFYQLTENRDYALAKKLFNQLSGDAQYLVRNWETINWHEGGLTASFENNDEIAKEILRVGQPIRDQIKSREGDTIKLFRGIEKETSERRMRPGRALFSWTSSKKIAQHFAGQRSRTKKVKPITDKEIQSALDRYNKTGFTTFRNMKYKKNKDNPEYYDIFSRHNNFVTDGDNLEREFRGIQQDYNDSLKRDQEIPGRVIEKEIPVKDIVWVLMGGNANEYIVNGHSE